MQVSDFAEGCRFLRRPVGARGAMTILAVLLAWGFGGVRAVAQGAVGSGATATGPIRETAAVGEEPSLAEQVRADVDATAIRWVGTFRVRVTRPAEASVGVGALAARVPQSSTCEAFCEYQGLALAVEPGLLGAQIGIGYARLVANRYAGAPFLRTVYVGWGARAVLLRTWGDSGLDPAAQTLAGLEGQFTVTRVSFSLGLLRRISQAHGEADDVVVTAGIGWGF